MFQFKAKPLYVFRLGQKNRSKCTTLLHSNIIEIRLTDVRRSRPSVHRRAIVFALIENNGFAIHGEAFIFVALGIVAEYHEVICLRRIARRL